MREYSTKLAVEEVLIDGERYEIREMTSAGRDKYLKTLGNTMQVRMVSTGDVDKDGREKMRKEVVVTSLGGAQAEILQSTLFKIADDGTATPITLKKIGELGAKLVEELATVASRLNGLERPDAVLEKEAEKN